MDGDSLSDAQWAALLAEPASQDILENLASEALAEEDAGLTLDLDALLEPDANGGYIVSDDVTLVYGSGDSPEAAQADYRASLTEYVALVRQGAERGSLKDRQELERLRLREVK